jgi:hypothetical protein
MTTETKTTGCEFGCHEGYITCRPCGGSGLSRKNPDHDCQICEGKGEYECDCSLAQDNANASACGLSRLYARELRQWG